MRYFVRGMGGGRDLEVLIVEKDVRIKWQLS